MNIYTPPGCRTLDQVTARQQVRLGIQGYPGTGKTWAALTFPNPIVLNLNKGIGAHVGRKDVIEVPREKFKTPTEVKDNVIEWLQQVGPKLTNEQTLIFDSVTDFEVYYHLWFNANKLQLALGSGGKVNDFAEWNFKEKVFDELFNLFQGLACDVVMITHESDQPDKPAPGQAASYSGKIRPLFTGKVKDKICHTFTDWFRQGSCGLVPDDKITPELLSDWKMTKPEFQAMQKTFPDKTLYYWLTVGDDKFDGKASSLVSPPKYMPANFSSFQKYTRKINQTATV